MDGIKTIEGGLVAKDLRIGIVAARFNEFIVDSLVKGAVDALVRHGVRDRDITLVRVGGGREMPKPSPYRCQLAGSSCTNRPQG